MPSRKSYDFREIQPRPIRDVAREAVTDLRKSTRLLAKWGVNVNPGSRLHQATEILEHAARTGVLAPTHRGDQLGLRALELAFDYAAIAHSLPPTRVTSVRRELEQSISGPLDPPEAGRGCLQLQAQYVVRAALELAGAEPYQPVHSPQRGLPSPDLLVKNGVSVYVIEVKRPERAKNVLARMRDARDQLTAYGLPGAILIDVTDCVRAGSSIDIDHDVQRLAQAIYDEVFEDHRGHRPGYADVMVAGTFARAAWTSTDYDEHSMVNVHTSSKIAIFSQYRNTLFAHRARWLRAVFQDGIGRLNLTLAEGRG